ncbi:MAG: hypothetical protein J5764_03825 [Bacteroidales bacterium]|nr:hypothetical protein [Bacteroidales bacterium]
MNVFEGLYKTDGITRQAEGAFRVSMSLNADSEIYKAHFPTFPITPGAAILQLAVEAFCAAQGRRFRLVSSRELKFLAPVIPPSDSSLVFEFTPASPEGELKYSVQVYCSDTPRAKFSLCFLPL